MLATEFVNLFAAAIDNKVGRVQSGDLPCLVEFGFQQFQTAQCTASGEGIPAVRYAHTVVLEKFATYIQIHIDADAVLLPVASHPPFLVDELQTESQRRGIEQRVVALHHRSWIVVEYFCRIFPQRVETVVIDVEMQGGHALVPSPGAIRHERQLKMPGLPVEAQAGDVVTVVGGVEDVFDRFHSQIFPAKIARADGTGWDNGFLIVSNTFHTGNHLLDMLFGLMDLIHFIVKVDLERDKHKDQGCDGRGNNGRNDGKQYIMPPFR